MAKLRAHISYSFSVLKEDDMQQNDKAGSYSNPVPWDFLGIFLADAHKKVEEALAEIPGTKLSNLEITLYPKIGADAPAKEFTLFSGEPGMRMVPDDQIIDEDEAVDIQQSLSSQEDQSAISHKASSVAEDIVQEKLALLRNELAGQSEVRGYAVGLRALVTTSNPGTWCSGTRCEYRLLKLRWELRRYFRKLDGNCGKQWLNQVCN